MKKLIALFVLLFSSVPANTKTNAVATSADSRATAAGAEILAKGGSASDAAMAMMLALTVVEPASSGIGGGGFLVYHDGRSGMLSTINGRETAPKSATPDRFLDAQGKPLSFLQAVPGGKSVGVPGNIRLMGIAHKKWGKIAWAKLFAPAIKLAEEGFEVNKTLESRLAIVAPMWAKFEAARSIYWVDGKPVTAGMRIKNPALAKTLRIIAKNGPEAFYKGEIAQGIVDSVTQNPAAAGDMTLADLAAYRAQQQDAVCGAYRVYTICGMGPPSSGATTVLQILGMLERFDMAALGKDNAQSWHVLGEAMQLAYADREKYLGDSNYVAVPVKGMIDRQYLAQRSLLIDADKARSDYQAGMPDGAMPRTAALSGEVHGTTHFTAVDAKGNIATMTSTVEGFFGSQLVSGGFVLNNELTDFTFAPEKDGAPVANRVQGGKRPLSSMSPTIVYDANGRPILALGSAGGKRIIMHVTKTLIGVLDFGLSLKDAIALPNIYFGKGELQVEQGTALAAMSAQLAAFGEPVRAADNGSKVNGAQLVGDGWVAAADPRSEGSAMQVADNGKITLIDGGSFASGPSATVH